MYIYICTHIHTCVWCVCVCVCLGVELGVVEDSGDDAGAVDGGVGVGGADEDLELGEEAVGFLSSLAYHREAAHALAIQSEVLGERLH